MLLCLFDYCGCSYHVRTTNRPSFLPSQLCYLGELSKLCFQISKVRTGKQRASQLLVQKVGCVPPRLFICVLFWVPKFDDTELPFFIISIDWVFPLFFLLCYPQSFWNQQCNGKYLNKTYKVFDLVRIFLPSHNLVKTLQTPAGLCGFAGFIVALFVYRPSKLVLRYLSLHALSNGIHCLCAIVCMFFLELALPPPFLSCVFVWGAVSQGGKGKAVLASSLFFLQSRSLLNG